ncbi:MAG TPA: sugar phosphate nucleotidyltransferase [Burkholderiaceae bacterium]
MQAIILAGGLGTRLRSVVADRPKVLAPVAGRPFLAWMLDDLVRAGFESVCLATGYLAEQIEEALGHEHVVVDAARSARLIYSHEDVPLGTGGAVWQALRHFSDKPTFVLNGDTYVRPDWRQMLSYHEAQRSRLTIGVRQVEDTSRYGAVEIIDGRITAFGEKACIGRGLINAGVYLVQSDTFAPLSTTTNSFSLERDLIGTHIAKLQPRAWLIDSPFLDIGVPEDFQRAEAFLRDAIASR